MRAIIGPTEASTETIIRWLVANVGPMDRDSAHSGSGWKIATSNCGITSVNLTDTHYEVLFNKWLASLQ